MLLLWLAITVQGVALWLACWQIRASKARVEDIVTRLQRAELRAIETEGLVIQTRITADYANANAQIAKDIASATCRYAFTPIGKPS